MGVKLYTRRDLAKLLSIGIAGTALESQGAITRSALALRGAMMGCGKKLPYDYEVEYIQSTGANYVDIGLKGDNLTAIEIEMEYPSLGQSGRFFGARSTYQSQAFAIYPNSGIAQATDLFQGNFGNTILNGPMVSLGRHIFKLSASDFNVDGVSYGGYPASTFTTPMTLKLFGHDQSSGLVIGVSRIYSFKMSRSGEVVADMIPVVKDGIAQFYDKARGILIGKSGTGELIAGPRVGEYDYRVYAITSSGDGQFIDLDYRPSNNTRIEACVSWDVAGRNLWGAYDDTRHLTAQTGGNWRFDSQTLVTQLGRDDYTNIWQDSSGIGNFISTWVYGSVSAFRSNLSFYLFSQNNVQLSSQTFASAKFKVFKILESNVLVRDLIPVVKGSKAYMFDRVSGRLFGNIGTGDFGWEN